MRLNISEIFIKTIVVGGVRAASAFVAFFLTAIATRELGASEAGLFLLGFTLLTVISSFSRLGLDNVLIRVVGADGLDISAQAKVNTAVRWVLVSATIISILIFLSSGWISLYIFNKPKFSPVLSWMMFSLPFFTLFNLLSFAFQGQHRVILAIIYQNLLLNFLFISFLLVIGEFLYFKFYAVDAAILYAMTSLVVFVMALWSWYGQAGVGFTPPSVTVFRDELLWRSSSNLWVTEIMALLVQWSGLILAGIYVNSDELAYLSAAQRTAGIASFVLIVVNMTVAPRYARLWKEQKLDEIRHLARRSTRVMIALMLPIMVVMVFMPGWVMKLFGPGFEQGAILLTIMAIGQFVNVATGSVGYLLNMSGHERDMKNVTLFSGPLTMICAAVLVHQFGALGAACATAIGVSAQNLGALWMVRKRLGFWPLG